MAGRCDSVRELNETRNRDVDSNEFPNKWFSGSNVGIVEKHHISVLEGLPTFPPVKEPNHDITRSQSLIIRDTTYNTYSCMSVFKNICISWFIGYMDFSTVQNDSSKI